MAAGEGLDKDCTDGPSARRFKRLPKIRSFLCGESRLFANRDFAYWCPMCPRSNIGFLLHNPGLQSFCCILMHFAAFRCRMTFTFLSGFSCSLFLFHPELDFPIILTLAASSCSITIISYPYVSSRRTRNTQVSKPVKMIDPLPYVKMFFRSVFSVFSPSTTTVWQNNIAYSITLHNPRLLLYRGPETYVTFSIYAQAYSAEARQRLDALSSSDISSVVKGTNVQLVQKGWIAGVVGWNAAGYLGVATKKGWDVTPEGRAGWKDTQADSPGLSSKQQEDEDWGEKPTSYRGSADEYEMQPLNQPEVRKETRHIALKRKEKIDKQIRAQSSTVDTVDTGSSGSTRVLGTYKCRIPVETGDGYFRFWVTLPSVTRGSSIGIGSPTFRLFSFSLTSASPRGAALLPIPVIAPELALRSVSIALTTIVYGLFPVATIIDKLLPRWMSRRFINWVYTRVGAKNKTEQLKEKYQVDKKVEQAREQVKKVPFASAGIRTEWDLENDVKRGRGGWAYHW